MNFPSFQSRHKLMTSGRNSQRHSTIDREKESIKRKRARQQDKGRRKLSTEPKKRKTDQASAVYVLMSFLYARASIDWLHLKLNFSLSRSSSLLSNHSVCDGRKSWKQLFACLPQRKRKTCAPKSFLSAFSVDSRSSVNKTSDKQSRNGNY